MKKVKVIVSLFFLILFSVKQSIAQTTLEEDCLQTLNVMSRALMEANLQASTLSDIASYWSAIGVRPSSISSNLRIARSGFPTLADPREYIPSTEQARRMCSELEENYGDVWGTTFTAQNQAKKVSFAVFQTDQQERARIPGTWAISNNILRSALRDKLQTLSVTYRLETNLRDGSERCNVFFSVLPEHFDVQLVNWRNPSIPDGILQIYNYVAFHIPVVNMVARDGSDHFFTMYYIDGFNIGNDSIIRLVERNYSAFNDFFDWDTVERGLRAFNRTPSNIVLSERLGTYQRDNHPIAQNPACVRALNAAREDYARSAR